MTTGDRLFLEMQDNPSEVRVAQFCSVRDAIRNAMAGSTLHCSFMEPLLEILRRLQQTLASLRQNILSDTETTRDSLRSLENQLWLRESEMDGFFSEIQRHHAAFVSQRNRMIESNLRLVASIAKKRGYLSLSGEDLIQEGNLALITVAEFFDPTKARFSTFATLRIESSLLRAADNQGHFIGRPVHVCERLRKVIKAARTFLEQFGETASVEQLAHSTGMAPAEIEELLRLKLPVDSLDAKCGQDGLTLLEKLAETHGESDRFESAA
jgi:RNA polymerase sigma factor (sigma-70 family)